MSDTRVECSLSSWTGRRKEQTAVASGTLAVLVLLIVIPHRIAEDGYLNHVAGSWAALADDWVHGVLYRPLLSEIGYGGTRNFPLHIVLHGWLTQLGFSLLTAGHLISLASAGLVVLAGGLGLSRLGAPRRMAWALAFLALASRTAVMGAAGIRGDILPVGLGVLGLALVPRDSSQAPFTSGLLLGLALVAKPTLLWAPGGAFISLIVRREFRAAGVLTAVVVLTAALGIGVASALSHGEMLVSFKACASGGGFSLTTLAAALHYVRPGDLLWSLGGAAFTLARGRRGLATPFGAATLLCIPVTLFLLTSKGTHVNHLVDATVVGALALAAAFADAQSRRYVEFTLLAATLGGLAELMLLDGMQMKRGELQRAAAALRPGRDPVLSEQPWIPLLAGERAFSIDAYNLLQTRRSVPGVDADLLSRIAQCRFREVVLLGRPDVSPWWYDKSQFGPGFAKDLLAHYALRAVIGAHAFYEPRCGVPASALPAAAAIQEETVLERGAKPNSLRVRVMALLGLHG